jgi:hypothetical protein
MRLDNGDFFSLAGTAAHLAPDRRDTGPCRVPLRWLQNMARTRTVADVDEFLAAEGQGLLATG